MSNKINSTTAGAGGLESTAHGDDGILLIQSDGVTVATFNTTGISGDGSQLTSLPAPTTTLLTTTNTTSGTTVTTATLDLSTYKILYVKLNNIGQLTDTGSALQWMNNGGGWQTIGGSPSDTTESYMGWIKCYMTDIIPNYGVISSDYGARGRDWNIAITGSYNMKFTTAMMIVPATTSISFRWLGGQTFNLGQVLIYGQK